MPVSPLYSQALNALSTQEWETVVKDDAHAQKILEGIDAVTRSTPENASNVAEALFEELQDKLDDEPEQESGEGKEQPKKKPRKTKAKQKPDDSAVMEQSEVAQSNSDEFDLAEYIVQTAKKRRKEILEGYEFQSKGQSITFIIPDRPEVTIESSHATLPLLVKAAGLRRPIMLVGPAGSGKTTAGHQLAQTYGVPFFANSNSQWDTRTQAFGYMDANGTYQPGYLYGPMKNGGVLLDDEIDASNQAVMVSKNTAIENRFAQFPNGETVLAHDNFIYVGSANTYGRGADRMYVGRTQLDAATLNRFIFIDWDYDEKLELSISCNEKWTKWVQKVRKVTQKHKMRYVVSPRQSIAGGELLALGIPERTVREMTVFPGWAEADIERVMREVN
jgi:MoxR-like ATPase